MPTDAELFIDCRNTLGEGPLWHHQRQELFWFDIIACKMFNADPQGKVLDEWTFAEPVSAAAILDSSSLLLASATGLSVFDIAAGSNRMIAELEADEPTTRSNDGRVDRSGRLWIGTMNRDGADGGGKIYRFAGGQFDLLVDHISIPNAICFSPNGQTAYWADTPTGLVHMGPADAAAGYSAGQWTTFTDTTSHRGYPDGAVTDSEGYLWSARWGGGCVVRHAPDGSIDRVVDLPVSNVTCPAFGGKDLRTLYITTAREHMTPEQLAAEPHAGSVFCLRVDVPGLPETPVRL